MSPMARLGAFMLVALLILGFLILRIERISLGGDDGQRTVQARFPTVAGLNEKGPVRIAGVRVGIVEAIGLEGEQALVTLTIDPKVQLRQGARAIVRSLGLLGEQYVEIDPGPPGAAPLPSGAVLPGGSPAGMDQLFDTANDLGTDLKAVTVSLRNAIGGPEGQRKLEQIVANIESLTESLRAIAQDNRAELNATVVNFRHFSETLRTEMPKLAEKLNSLAEGLDGVVAEYRENIAGSMANIRELSDRLKVTADNINTITGKIAKGEGTIGKLVNDETTVTNLNDTLKSVQDGVASLKDTLGRPGRWTLNVDMQAEQLPKIDDSRASFNANLFTTERRFFRLGMTSSPRGREIVENETVTSSFDGGPPQTFTQETRRYSNDFTMNAQVGYRIGRTAFRAGLIESTGGAGIDHTLIKDKLDVSFDVYDFGRKDESPHLRLQTRWFVTPNIYTYAGYDDPLAEDRRSVLFGAGITWNDEDLKYLLGTAASLAN